MALLKALGAGSLFGLLLAAAVSFCSVRVDPHQVGVRQSLWGGGIDETDYGAGLYLHLPGLSSWRMLDASTRFLSFGDKDGATAGAPGTITAEPFDLRTSENNTAIVSVALPFRIRSGSAHRIVAEGLEQALLPNVRDSVRDVLREELAKLSSEEWFDVDRRSAVAREALPAVNAALEPLFVEAEAIWIQDVSFLQDYERKLQTAQIVHQKRELKRAEERLEEAVAERVRMEQETSSLERDLELEWDGRIQELRAQAALELAEIEARTTLYDAETRAQAKRAYADLVAEGQAAFDDATKGGEERRLRALDTPGGRVWLAREAARNLKLGNVLLDSSDPRVPSVFEPGQLVQSLTRSSVAPDTQDE